MSTDHMNNVIYINNAFAARRLERQKVMSVERELKRKADAIRLAFSKRPRVESVKQRIMLAENLWQILESLERQGYHKVDVVKEARLGDEYSSTKRLYNYTLDPTKATRPTNEDLSRRLTKSAEKYLRIIRAAASVSGLSEGVLLQQFVNGTDYDVSLSEEALNSPTDPYEEIAEFLTSLGGRIAAKHRLSEFQRYVSHQNIIYSPSDREFVPSLQPDTSNPFEDEAIRSLSWFSGLSALRYGPFLHLYDYLIAEALGAEVEKVTANGQSIGSPLHRGDVWVYERVFLGYLPIGLSGESQLCFVSEIHTELDENASPFPSEYVDHYYGYPTYSPGSLLCSVLQRSTSALHATLLPEDDRGQFIGLAGRARTTIHTISASSCARFLSRRADDYRLEDEDFEGLSLKRLPLDSYKSTAPSGSVAQRLDGELYREDRENRFDKVLEEQIERFIAAVEAHRLASTASVEDSRAKILKEWE
jgi:hypothetical protein